MGKVLLGMLTLASLVYGSADEVEDQEYASYEESIEGNSEDMWFGPGYYYGIWFDHQGSYNAWRRNHQEYPPNHDYYSPDHPIEYRP